MIELVLVLLLSAAGAAERVFSARRWEAERRHLLAIITAARVSPASAAAVARAAPAEPRTIESDRPVAIGL